MDMRLSTIGRETRCYGNNRWSRRDMDTLDFGLLILRVVVGGTMFAHGAQKAFGWWAGPGYERWRNVLGGMGFQPVAFWTAVSIAAELSGGLLLLGFLTPLVAALIVAQAIVIIGQVHLAKGFFNTAGGFEFPLSLGAGAAALLFTGPGGISVDALIGFSVPATARVILFVLAIAGGLLALGTPHLLARPQGVDAQSGLGRRPH
jgi:putative oxidoreductase